MNQHSHGHVQVSRHLGSLQVGEHHPSDDPVEEAWSVVDLWGSSGYLDELLTKAKDEAAAHRVGEYFSVRLRQASEFRRAATGGTLLTRPTLLYYSALNLTRAVLAIRSDDLSKKRDQHGLSFRAADELLECSSKPSKSGTFARYCGEYSTDSTLTLEASLARIPEIAGDFQRSRLPCKSAVVALDVVGHINRTATLTIPGVSDIQPELLAISPRLADRCSAGATLAEVVLDCTSGGTNSREAIGATLNDLLLTDLTYGRFGSKWFLVRPSAGETVLPRAAYYLSALHTLSNLSRYEPSLLADQIHPRTQVGWLLERFLKASERFYPQLMINEVLGEMPYFSYW